MKDKKNITFIQNLFQKKFDLRLDKIPESQNEKEKSADLQLVHDNKVRFVCELKTLNYVELSEETGYVQGEEEGEFWKDGDAAANKIARLIKDAYEQLSKYSCPKGLIFLNEAFDISEQDYYKAIRGHLPFADKASGTTTNEYLWHKISDGKIRDIKKKIDFYCWINKKGDEDQIFFDKVTTEGKRVVEKYFAQQRVSGSRT